jgi:hypothetical protein
VVFSGRPVSFFRRVRQLIAELPIRPAAGSCSVKMHRFNPGIIPLETFWTLTSHPLEILQTVLPGKKLIT